MRASLLVVASLAASGCRGTTTPAPPTAAERGDAADPRPMSDPAEYAIEHVSRDAGEAIFTRTGIGDPYRTGVPYPVFLALLRGYPEIFGATTQELAARFGFVPRPAVAGSADLDEREGLPLGMHLTVDPITGVPFVVTSCVLCHAGTVRLASGDQLIVGLGNKRIRIHDYDAAFAEVTRRDDFTRLRIAELAEAVASEHAVAWPIEWSQALVAATVDALERRADVRAELRAHTANGPPGRVATIESFAIALEQTLGRDVALPAAPGWAKIPDVIGFGQRVTLSWDAIGEGPMDVLVVEADVAAGVREAWFWSHPLQGASLGAYLRQPAARPRFPGTVDATMAARGRASFEDNCAPCHGHYDERGRVLDYTESVVALEDVGTDPARAEAATPSFLEAANDEGLTRGLTRTRRTGGYVPPVLTNVWARAPYGHAGQWASLAMIAMEPEERPERYVIDFEGLYDLVTVGLPIRSGTGTGTGTGTWVHEAGTIEVGGHPFLSSLEAGEKAAILEYLKTL